MMKGYTDSVIPPLPELSPLHEADHTVAIQNRSWRNHCRDGQYKEEVSENVKRETEKRYKMKENFMVLQPMILNIVPKASGERIIDERISLIEFPKQEMKGKMAMYSNWNSSINVTALATLCSLESKPWLDRER